MNWLLISIPTATVAALAGTWSPCGLSMLSTFTPIREAAHGRRFAVTAAWFILGAVLGGAALGSLSAVGAISLAALRLDPSVRAMAVSALFLLGAAWDAGWLRPALPHHRRQVNETWLRQFRRWFTASGFGVQIGFGLATYIMTTGVYLTILTGVASARPAVAALTGVWFGAVRGMVVLSTAKVTTSADLIAIHQRLEQLRSPVRHAVAVLLLSFGAVIAAATLGVDERFGILALGTAGLAAATWTLRWHGRAVAKGIGRGARLTDADQFA